MPQIALGLHDRIGIAPASDGEHALVIVGGEVSHLHFNLILV